MAKLVKKVKSQRKTHLFDLKDPIYIIGFLAAFKFACDTNNIHKETAMWGIPHYVEKTLDNTLNSRMCTECWLTLLATSMQKEGPRSRKLFWSYPEVVKYLLMKYAIDQATVEYDAAILHYVQPKNITPQQFAKNLVAKSCKITNVYNKNPLKDVFIEGVCASIHSLQHNWSTNNQADLTDIAFRAESVLSIQRASKNAATNNLRSTSLERSYL